MPALKRQPKRVMVRRRKKEDDGNTQRRRRCRRVERQWAKEKRTAKINLTRHKISRTFCSLPCVRMCVCVFTPPASILRRRFLQSLARTSHPITFFCSNVQRRAYFSLSQARCHLLPQAEAAMRERRPASDNLLKFPSFPSPLLALASGGPLRRVSSTSSFDICYRTLISLFGAVVLTFCVSRPHLYFTLSNSTNASG